MIKDILILRVSLMPQISIIIPVYNVELYLEQCLNSILEQTFKDIEVICVNNSSTDKSLEILEKYAQKDKRLRIFTEENKGPGSGRNKGLDEATGKYVLFVDADDFVDIDLCQTLYEESEKNNLDVCSCDYLFYHNKTNTVSPRSKALQLDCRYDLDRANGDTTDDFAKFFFAFSATWLKLIRRDLIEKASLRFPYGAVEDVPFVVSLGVRCNRIKMLEKPLGYYRVAQTTNISSDASRMLIDGIKNFAFLENNLRNYGVFEEVKETFLFNKMVLLIGDEKLFAGRLGNIPYDKVQQAYNLIREDMASLDERIFNKRNAFFRWKVRRFKRAVAENDFKFPKKLRRLRNIAMTVLDPYFKLIGRK